ncbi:hypothetical protein WN982_32715 [Paraburkholderia sp. IMGN_8]|uniref:hypothetical protein n=1 Tax=Paraburkholderia sp. IMGN_8 TaxID=3136564 RepID=UPI003100DB31
MGSCIAMLNATVPLMLVLLNRANLSLLLGNPHTTSSLYAVVCAGDLLLTVGLIVLALQHLIVERNMLATLDQGALQHLAGLREARGLREPRLPRFDAIGNDKPVQCQSLPGPV